MRWFRAGAEDGRVGKSKPNNDEREGSAAQAQRRAEQSTKQLASGQKPMCRRYPCCRCGRYLVPFCGRGLLGRTA